MKCPICKIKTWKLVPFADSDHNHEGKMTCVKCKRKAKNVFVLETGENNIEVDVE